MMKNDDSHQTLDRRFALWAGVALIALMSGGAMAQDAGGAPADPSSGGGTPTPTTMMRRARSRAGPRPNTPPPSRS